MADKHDVKPIVRVEDLEAKLRRLAEGMAEAGREAGQEMRVLAQQSGKVFRIAPSDRSFEDLIASAMRALEDEIAVAEAARPAATKEEPERCPGCGDAGWPSSDLCTSCQETRARTEERTW
jgi:hypothetical protein